MWSVMLICAEWPDAANGPGKCCIADSCEGLGAMVPPPPFPPRLISFRVVFQRWAVWQLAVCLPLWCNPPPGRGVEFLPAVLESETDRRGRCFHGNWSAGPGLWLWGTLSWDADCRVCSGWELRSISFLARSAVTLPLRSRADAKHLSAMKKRKLSRVETLWKVSVVKLFKDTRQPVCYVKRLVVLIMLLISLSLHLKDSCNGNYRLQQCWRVCVVYLFIRLSNCLRF